MTPTRTPAREPQGRHAPLRQGEAGFTLLELLVALTILVLIAAVAVPQTIRYLDRAKTDTARVAIGSIEAALDLYRLDVGRYPEGPDGLQALIAPVEGVTGWNGPYLRKAGMLADPWGNGYLYRQPGQHGAYDLYTLGADGREGGDGADRDVVNWE